MDQQETDDAGPEIEIQLLKIIPENGEEENKEKRSRRVAWRKRWTFEIIGSLLGAYKMKKEQFWMMSFHESCPTFILGKQVEILLFNGQFLKKCALLSFNILPCRLCDWKSLCCTSIWVRTISLFWIYRLFCVSVIVNDFFGWFIIIEVGISLYNFQ